MSKTFIKLIGVIILFGVFNNNLKAQNNEQIALEEVLKLLETRYNVRFSYIPSAIDNMLVILRKRALYCRKGD